VRNEAGLASRVELYGSLWLVVMGLSIVWDRSTYHQALLDATIRDRERPNIVQNNNQQVTIESERAAIVRSLKTDVSKPTMPANGGTTRNAASSDSSTAKNGQ
jgi:hypothetical protein